MKIAFISDIHSNYFYFKKVMLQIEKSNVDEIYCLGDMIGYYDKPDKVTELIINKNIKCIKGNHEKYLLGEIGYNKKNENIYRIENQRRTLSKENLNFLQSLPDSIEKKIDNKKFYLTHSLPNNTTSYIRSIHDLDSINSKNYDYYCFAPRGKLSYFYRQIKEIIDDYSLNASDTEMINNLLSQKKQLAAVLALYQTNKNMP